MPITTNEALKNVIRIIPMYFSRKWLNDGIFLPPSQFRLKTSVSCPTKEE